MPVARKPHDTEGAGNPRPGRIEKYGVDDGARTHDNRNHNPGLYQLSYVHHKLSGIPPVISQPSVNKKTCHNRVWRARQDSNLRPSA